jgi:hypothetical protein
MVGVGTPHLEAVNQHRQHNRRGAAPGLEPVAEMQRNGLGVVGVQGRAPYPRDSIGGVGPVAASFVVLNL